MLTTMIGWKFSAYSSHDTMPLLRIPRLEAGHNEVESSFIHHGLQTTVLFQKVEDQVFSPRRTLFAAK
jgi:hypothetical protein